MAIRFPLLAFVLCFSPLFAEAQMTHITPFTGVWKLNAAQSQFDPGPPFKSFTLNFTPDGVRHLDLVRADGQSLIAALPWSDGQEVIPDSASMQNTTAVSKIEGREFHDTWKHDGKITERVQGVVSPDGKTLTIIVDGTDPQGHAFHNRLRFDKQ